MASLQGDGGSIAPGVGPFPRLESVGFWAALIAFLAAASYDVCQVLEVQGVFPLPWGGVAIYLTSLVIAVPFAVAVLTLHYLTPIEHRFWSGAALMFAIMYATFATLNYVVQLTVTIPFEGSNTILNESPHTLFWTIDALAYILLGISMLFAYRLFWRPGIERWARGFFLANAAVTPLICVVYFYPVYTNSLLWIGSPWGITAPGAVLTLALYFHVRLRPVTTGGTDLPRPSVPSPR